MARKTDVGKSLNKPLSAQERLFIEAYTGPANYNKIKALEAAYPAHINNKKTWKESEANQVLARPHVANYLRKHQESVSKEFHLSEVDILNRLWVEATREDEKAQHSARISALVWLGKHLGMFQEKRQEAASGPASATYNIVNYSTYTPSVERVVEAAKEATEQVNNLPANVQVKSWDE